MFGIFKRKTKNAAVAMKKMEKRDLMEAVVGGSLLVAAADGEITQQESKKIDALLRSNAALQHFGSEMSATINRMTEQLMAGFRVGRLAILREIEDIQSDREDAEQVLVNMLTVAEADGSISEDEQKVLELVASRLGLRLEDYL